MSGFFYMFTEISADMACTKYTLAQYTALNEAIALGAKKVKYGDKEVEYNSLSEMLQLQAKMETCLFPANSNTTNSRTYAAFSKGTGCRRRRYY
jgi:hypothetical protein